MLLSKAQQARFWREWSVVCKLQGWTKAQSWTGAQIDNERHALLSRAGFNSLTKVDPLKGFDRVLAELAAMTRPDDLAPQLNIAEQPKTRLLFAIRNLGKQISIAELQDGTNAYVARIASDRFGKTDLESLSLYQLEQLRNTLAARLSAHRRKQKDLVDVADNVPF
jgi:hypothetical protein